ncbi:Cna B-type domain-containing protein [Vagococcus fluvialis]|uniref:Cna B-type domain-containing protein n=1 Tax=Vagococcus fluvialis TaxID=2738 RepID=UPI003B5B7349
MKKRKKGLSLLLLLTLLLNIFLPVAVEANELLNGGSVFQYTPDGERGGAYPTNETNLFPGGASGESIKNFNYGDFNYQGTPPTKQVVPGLSAFDGGYHTYTDNNGMEVYTKKTVSPTEDPTRFKVDLDVISGKRIDQEKIDIAFVIDKSGSMQGKRWNALKSSVSFFADNFPTSEYNAQFAIASFASYNSGSIHVPYFQLSKNSDGKFFTNDPTRFKNNALLKTEPSGGTPTFLGVEAGVELLANPNYGSRADAHQFLIFLTDGSPTWTFKSKYKGIDNLSPDGLMYSIGSDYYSGNGIDDISTSKYTELISFINDRYARIPNAKKYSIGIGNQFGASGNNQNLMKALGPGPEGTHYVGDSGSVANDLKNVLHIIQNSIVATASNISEATIIDPMSDYVDIEQGSVSTYQLTLNQNGLNVLPTDDTNALDYGKKAIVNTDNNQLTVSNLSLSADYDSSQGYRASYHVTLKEAYQDGHFYPANKTTYLTDKNHPNGLEFAVPSVKYKAVKNIDVEKVWKGDSKEHPTITLTLLANEQEVDSVELSNGQTKHTFVDLPNYDQNGEKINYQIKEAPVKGYQSEVKENEDGSFTVTNYPKGDFDAVKLADKEVLKPGEEFTYTISVTNTVTDSTLKNLSVEDTIPDTLEVVSNVFLNGQDVGAISANLLQVTIPELKGKEVANITFKVKVKETTPAGEIINKAKITNPEDPEKPKEPEVPVKVIRETDVQLLKTSMDGTTILPNATFSIQNLADKSETQTTTDNSGKITFSKLTPGDYLIKEQQAPDGFKIMRDPIKMTIDKFGVVSVTESNESFVSVSTVGNQFEIKVKNEERGILPLTGGNGHIKYLIPAAILFSSSLFLSIYYLFRRRKGWN